MKRKLNKVLSALLALVMCIGMLPAAAMPVAAAELGANEWVVRNDGFEDYPTGTDTFWLNDRYAGFSNSYHSYTLAKAEGDPEGTIYGSRGSSYYNIVEEANGNKYLELVSVDMCANRFTAPTVSGAYSMTMDLYMPRDTGPSVPGVILSLGYKGTLYIDGGDGARLMGVGLTSPDYYVKGEDGKKIEFKQDAWYTVKLSVEPGRFIVKLWAKGGTEPADDATAGVIVFEDAETLTAEKLNSGMTPTITSRARGTKTKVDSNEYIVRVDNLKITKPYDTVTLPAALQGTSGDRVIINASFAGQNLAAQVPAPRFSYTLSDSKLGHVAPGNYLILGEEGQGAVTVEAIDMDGKPSGATWSIPLTVTAAAQTEQPLRILSIGNGYSRDTLYYVDKLAALVGKQVEVAYLSMTDATLRYHAHNVAMNTADYSYYKSDSTGLPVKVADSSTINEVVNGQNWDIVMLQQGGASVGMNNTFAGDLRYLLDYLADAQPNAKVYWNMNTANQQDTTSQDNDILDAYYDGSQIAMYNAIVGCLEMFIVGEDAEYADDFAGWFPVGAVIQSLRANVGDNLTRDGYQLSLQAGRLAAAMTVLKVLFPSADLTKITPNAVAEFLVTDKTDNGTTFPNDPSYNNDAANLTLIRQSVEAACANLNKAPAKLAYSPATIESATGDATDVTVGQTDAPLNLRFADIVVTQDGTVYAGAYESVTHVPARAKLPYTEYCPEGYGRLKIWKSTDNGKTWDFDNPILTIDQHELEDWGISPGLYNRYERLKSGVVDYAFFNDARDANLGLMYHDMDGDGDKEEVLMFTFFCNDYNESGTSTFRGTFILHSVDGGKSWSVPQRIVSKVLGKGGGKRGDMAVFSDGQLLFPMYSHPKVAGVLLQWNVETQQWDTIADTEIPNYVPEKTTDFTEPSFIAPDPDGDIVYGFVRDNGQAVISYDRGRSWEHIHTIDGNVQQPGWAYIDQTRAFATWSFADGGTRPTKGQMVYFDAGWEATQPKVVHPHYNPVGRDTGDPSAKLLANGKLLTITYDTFFRAINGKFLDPEAPEFQIPELYDDAAEVVLYSASTNSPNVTLDKNLPSTHTIHTTATFAANGQLTVTAANGAVVEFAAGKYGIETNKATELRVAVVGKATYVKAWPVGGIEPDSWTAVQGGTDKNSGKAVLSGSNVTMNSVKITRRAIFEVEEGEVISAGMATDLVYSITPTDMADKLSFNTNNANVATVDAQGKITFKSAGTVTITVSMAGKSASATYVVQSVTGEAAGEGNARTIFADDFEDYTSGDDAFLKQMVSHGYESLNTSNSKVMESGYHIVEEDDGNQYLELVGENGKYAWCVVDMPITGDYTVQFDFLHKSSDAGKGTTFLNLWHGTKVYTMVQIGDEGFQIQHKDAESGLYMNSNGFASHKFDNWYTMKVARVDGGVYAKTWLQGTEEPEYWMFCSLAEEMDTNNTAKFRFSSAAEEDEVRSVLIDNIVITKQTQSDTPEWIVRNDDFNNRTAGTDKFWKDSKYSGFSESYHSHRVQTGTILGFIPTYTTYYSRYNIVAENDNRMLELVSDYDVINSFNTTTVTGAYSTTVDIYMPESEGTSVPGIIINPFFGTTLSSKAAIYIDGNDGVRIRETISGVDLDGKDGEVNNFYVNSASSTKMKFELDTWYTVKMSVAPGKFMVKAWPRGGVEPADDSAVGVHVLENASISENILNSGVATGFQTRTRSDKATYVVRLDNLKISKPYESLNLPAELTGKAGETATLNPTFTGQNLMAYSPKPTIRYSSFGEGVASVSTTGVVTFGEQGEGKVLVELLDMDGKSNGADWEVRVTVGEPEPEPEPDPEPDEPEEPAPTLGRFSLEVINYIIVNGEEVAICRWVWTPLNKQ